MLWDAVREGRRGFANVIKCIRMGANSNFGNMLSMVLANGFLPDLTTPLQILTANLLGVFRTGWFVASLMTRALVILVIRTNRIPFVESQAGTLTVTAAPVAAIGIWLAGSPLTPLFGFAPLPAACRPFVWTPIGGYRLIVHRPTAWLGRTGSIS